MADESALPDEGDRASGRGASVAVDVAARVGEAWDEIRKLELDRTIAELEAVGLTVVEPERAAAPGFAERLRDAIVRVGEERSGTRLDLDAAHEAGRGAFGDVFGLQLYYLLFEDKVFQEAIVNPVALALSTYLLGESCIISNCLAGVKGPGGGDLGLHSDNVMIPAPFPPYAQVCNVTWALTDYDDDSGPLVYVPGSHRLCRHPLPGEGRDAMVPVRARAGSIIFWHGNLWHGALARRAPGLRVNLIVAMMRSYLRPQEPYREHVTQAILDDNPPRFATLLGQHVYYGWREDGPRLTPLSSSPGSAHQFD
jgi:ectoine hydroxylase-related dioxygenase (phytanoyl-CoA dioxygenase family)